MKKILITLELEVSDDFGSSKLDVVQDDVIDGVVLFRKDWEETPEDEEQFKLKDVKIRNIDTREHKMNEIEQLKELMEEFEITGIEQLYNEIDSMGIDEATELSEKVKVFLESPEAELAIQIYFNKEEYEDFTRNENIPEEFKDKTVIEHLKISFGL